MPQGTSSPALRLAVVGGGVSGLAAAHRIAQLLPRADVRLFEAGPRLGGPLDSQRQDDWILERGADSFLTRDAAILDLCRDLGLDGELLPTNSEHRRALVVCRGRLEPVPDGFVLMQPRNLQAVFDSPILSLAGKWRLAAEPIIRRRRVAASPDDDESIASFATRRLGREAYERLVEPLVAGIYVADGADLSLAGTMPDFLAAERTHGSLRAALKAEKLATTTEAGARYSAFVTLKSGMSALVRALAKALPDKRLHLSTPILSLSKGADGGWLLKTAADEGMHFDGVVLAAPAARMAPLVASFDPRLSELLSEIRAASSVVATLVYARSQIAHPLDAFGLVVPRIENRPIVAASFPSVKFPGRGTTERTPIRVFMGGAMRPKTIERDDADLVTIAHRELVDLLGVRGEPREALVARWPESMPQYRVGHLRLVASIDDRLSDHRGLQVAGASYRGVGIPQCVRSGREAAERLVGQLANVE